MPFFVEPRALVACAFGLAKQNPDCEYIAYSDVPDARKICSQTIDFRNPRRCVLHQFGDVAPIELEPAEFRTLDTVVLKPGEKLNRWFPREAVRCERWLVVCRDGRCAANRPWV